MNTQLSSIFSVLSDLLIPPRETERTIRSITLDDVRALRSLDSGSLPYHHEITRALVWEVKYYANKRALKLCGAFVAEILMDIRVETLGVPLLVPIPMHTTRLRKRGHNQTELLCTAALLHLGELYDYAPHALVRIKDTAPQQGLSALTRRKNVTNSMQALDEEVVRGRTCLVIDDVSTTGATFAEATRALKEAGAATVLTVALAQS